MPPRKKPTLLVQGEPWKRVLRRASSEEEARTTFAQAEAALDADREPPVGADVRAAVASHQPAY